MNSGAKKREHKQEINKHQKSWIISSVEPIENNFKQNHMNIFHRAYLIKLNYSKKDFTIEKNALKKIYLQLKMSKRTKIKEFVNLDEYPDLKTAIVPAIRTLPSGSVNTKVIISRGSVIERIYKTPRGELISLCLNDQNNEAA
ncbi:hypothetical protein [Prochlorococcus sp. MIT 0801]|uniref:hypothetical protein n=1 Tax=Prochlorococcus sp. MIT 0801 TaxID=1501269 RepID=UPI000A6E3380|nr:hypothetical protein [Prochlorococcus sp. MIT 0801]